MFLTYLPFHPIVLMYLSRCATTARIEPVLCVMDMCTGREKERLCRDQKDCSQFFRTAADTCFQLLFSSLVTFSSSLGSPTSGQRPTSPVRSVYPPESVPGPSKAGTITSIRRSAPGPGCPGGSAPSRRSEKNAARRCPGAVSEWSEDGPSKRWLVGAAGFSQMAVG